MRLSKFVVPTMIAALLGGAAVIGAPTASSANAVRAVHAVRPVKRAGFTLRQVIGAGLLKGPGAYDTPDVIATAPKPDNRIFIGEQSGRILVFHGLTDTAPKLLADLSSQVLAFNDRGLLGLVVDPHFPASPYVYVMYSRNSKTRGGPVPGWPNDKCSKDTPTGGGCVTYTRIARLTVSGDHMTASKTLIDDWCTQFGHAGAALRFGPDGDLYASAGEGATQLLGPTGEPDYGQWGNPENPCGDPPAGVGGSETPPTSEGGSLRAQDVRTPGDPTGLNGTIIRIKPATGDPAPGNPFASSSDKNAQRIIAYGLRNPFRFTFRPGTKEIWIADAGWLSYEEVDRIPNATDSTAENFGWPCYEGPTRQPNWQSLGLNLCTSLYALEGHPGGATLPSFNYSDQGTVVPNDGCPETSKGTVITGVAFYTGNNYPGLHNALFFGDLGRNCIYAAPAGANGVDFVQRRVVAKLPSNQVGITDIGVDPASGNLLFVDIYQHRVLELQHS